MNKQSCSASDIADIVINLYQEKNKEITNLKLQKVLYYIQLAYLKQEGKPLIDEDFEAWRHGPVIPSLYDKFKIYVSDSIKATSKLNITKLTKSEREVVEDIVERTLTKDEWELVNDTQQTQPWAENYICGYSIVIPKSEMKNYGTINI